MLPEVGLDDVEVDVQGQSGKFTVYSAAAGRDAGVTVEMDALREVDTEGNAVGTSGSEKHSIQTFASQDFTITYDENVTFGGVSANKIAFESSVSTIGNIRVLTYIMNEGGEVGEGNETFSVKRGDVKWNIELFDWQFCGVEVDCAQGQTEQFGEYIELDVTVKGAGTAGRGDGNNNLIELGAGASLTLSNEVIVDGSVATMPEVRTSLQGSSTVITFKFPKFNSSALYDPVVSLGTDTASTSMEGSSSPSESSTTVAVDSTSGVKMSTSSGASLDSTSSAPHGSTSSSAMLGSTSTSDLDSTTTPPMLPEVGLDDVEVDVQGQSGKFTVYSAAAGRDAGVTVEMDALREVDTEGNAVGTSGSEKHSIQTFASQDFTITYDENVTFGGVSANKIAFESSVSTIGNIRVLTYIMNEGGEVGEGNETFSVKRGDVKWNIELFDWQFCGVEVDCAQGQTEQFGEYIELDVTVKGAGTAGRGDGNNNLIELGAGASLTLSNEVIVDGSVATMPEVRTSLQGSSTVIMFKFPRFNSSALYDPVFSLGSPPASTTTETAQNSESTSLIASSGSTTSSAATNIATSTVSSSNSTTSSEIIDPDEASAAATAFYSLTVALLLPLLSVMYKA